MAALWEVGFGRLRQWNDIGCNTFGEASFVDFTSIERVAIAVAPNIKNESQKANLRPGVRLIDDPVY